MYHREIKDLQEKEFLGKKSISLKTVCPFSIPDVELNLR